MSERILMVALHYVGVTNSGSPIVPPLYYATRSHVNNTDYSYGTDPFYVDGRLTQPGLIERTMYGAGRLRGATPVADGAIVLSNADGELDDILGYSFDGQPFYLFKEALAQLVEHLQRVRVHLVQVERLAVEIRRHQRATGWR